MNDAQALLKRVAGLQIDAAVLRTATALDAAEAELGTAALTELRKQAGGGGAALASMEVQ